MLTLLSVLIHSAFAGIYYLPFGVIFEWHFPDTETVSYQITVPNELSEYNDYIDYRILEAAGVDITNRKDTIVIFFENNKVVDAVGGIDTLYLYTDTDEGGTDDILNPSFEVVGENTVYTYQKLLNTGDDCDIHLFVDNAYRLVYSNSTKNEDGTLSVSLDQNYSFDFVFSEDYGETAESFIQLDNSNKSNNGTLPGGFGSNSNHDVLLNEETTESFLQLN